MTTSHKVGQKGQVVIAKEIRERLGVKRGWLAVQRLVGDHVEIYFLAPAHRQSLKGSVAGHIRRRVPPGPAWDTAREQAWRAAFGEARESPRKEPAE
jgi:AbrB family looped-hinge helix DNA binding protein